MKYASAGYLNYREEDEEGTRGEFLLMLNLSSYCTYFVDITI